MRARLLRLIVYLGVFATLIFGWVLGEPIIFEGSPYEGWDECMAYSQATPMSLETRFQNETYGSIEEFKFRVAKFIYQHFDSVGRNLSPRRWTNNVLSSYLRPSDIFESPSFDGNYSRGILDRRPFIIARYLNSIGGLILSVILCGYWLVRYRYQALFLIVPLVWFLVSAGYWLEAVAVTPNAWNALLAIIVFVSLIDVIERQRPVGLYISAALLAFGANCKTDFLFLGGPLVVTWIVADFKAETVFRRWIRPALVCVLLFLAVLVLTNPRLLYALPLVIGEQLRLLHEVRGQAAIDPGHGGIGYNRVVLFDEFLTECLGAPWNVAKLHSLSTAAFGVCLLFPLSVILSSSLDIRRKGSILVVLGSFYLCLWLMPLILATHAYDRYFLSGSGVAMISVGYACRYLWRENSRLLRFLAVLVLCLCAVFYLGQVKQIGREAITAKEELENGALDGTVSRNEAVLKIINLIESGKYSKQVIIDQHSYTDIRAFLEKGITVTLINVFNFQQELEKIQVGDKPTLGLYVPGKGMGSSGAWEGKWNDHDSALYDRYINYLAGFETVAKYGENPMFLLSWGPVDPNDEVVIFETKRPNSN
jgi:hypothetical protein